MQTALIIIGITSASLAGSAIGYWGFEQAEQRKLHASYLLQAGAAAERQALGFLHVNGLARAVIEIAMTSSDEQAGSRLAQAPLWYFRSNTLERLMKKAGLGRTVDRRMRTHPHEACTFSCNCWTGMRHARIGDARAHRLPVGIHSGLSRTSNGT